MGCARPAQRQVGVGSPGQRLRAHAGLFGTRNRLEQGNCLDTSRNMCREQPTRRRGRPIALARRAAAIKTFSPPTSRKSVRVRSTVSVAYAAEPSRRLRHASNAGALRWSRSPAMLMTTTSGASTPAGGSAAVIDKRRVQAGRSGMSLMAMLHAGPATAGLWRPRRPEQLIADRSQS
jgi:hypothetical protein